MSFLWVFEHTTSRGSALSIIDGRLGWYRDEGGQWWVRVRKGQTLSYFADFLGAMHCFRPPPQELLDRAAEQQLANRLELAS